jgi:hypothetical protein
MYIRLITTATGSILRALRHQEALLTHGQSHLLGLRQVAYRFERTAPAPPELCAKQTASYTEAPSASRLSRKAERCSNTSGRTVNKQGDQVMLGILSKRWEMPLAALLVGAAAIMFAIAIPAGEAASLGGGGGTTATQTQELEATINSEVSWGSANDCTENISVNDFGDLVPSPTSDERGTFNALPETESSTDSSGNHVWVGCVTTNTDLTSVEAQGTKDMEDGSATLPLSDVAIGITNAQSGEINGGEAGCEVEGGQANAGSCTLETGAAGQDLVTNADEGTTELNWQYQLDLPANQPVGTYTGGQVTFTATAEPKRGGGSPS